MTLVSRQIKASNVPSLSRPWLGPPVKIDFDRTLVSKGFRGLDPRSIASYCPTARGAPLRETECV